MNASTPAAQAELLEQLSAYLDGELDADTSRQIEQILAGDERARDVLRRLEQASSVLDELPRREVQPSFTTTTISMVALSEADAIRLQRPAATRGMWARWLLRLGGLVLALATGFIAVAAVRPRPNELLLRDLAVIDNLEAYRHAGNLEFLRQLQAREIFADAAADPSAESLGQSQAARRTWVNALGDEQQDRLLDNLERYQRLPSAEQAHLRALDASLAKASDGAELLAIMLRYHAWLDQLPAVQRAELLTMDDDRRFARIQELRTVERRRVENALSAADVKVLADAIEQALRKLPPAERQRMMIRLIALRWQPLEPVRGFNLIDLTAIRDRLSPEAQKHFGAAATPQQKQDLFGNWLRQAIGSLMARNPRGKLEVSDDRLRQFFETQISEPERERLLMLPAEEMRMQLRRMYQFSTMNSFPRRDGEGRTQNAERKVQN